MHARHTHTPVRPQTPVTLSSWLARIQQQPPRRRAVWQLYALGQTHAEIAQALGITPSTVKGHLALVRDQTGAYGRSEMLATAVLCGFITPQDCLAAVQGVVTRLNEELL